MDKQNLTPMMQQYMKTKEEYKDCICFIVSEISTRCFFDDRKDCLQGTELTLTGKNCGLEETCSYVWSTISCGRRIFEQNWYPEATRLPSVSRWRIGSCERDW